MNCLQVGDRVIAITEYSAWAEVVVVPTRYCFKMPTGGLFYTTTCVSKFNSDVSKTFISRNRNVFRRRRRVFHELRHCLHPVVWHRQRAFRTQHSHALDRRWSGETQTWRTQTENNNSDTTVLHHFRDKRSSSCVRTWRASSCLELLRVRSTTHWRTTSQLSSTTRPTTAKKSESKKENIKKTAKNSYFLAEDESGEVEHKIMHQKQS